MKNLINFFFSFDKLFKEKLVVPAFWLAIIYFGLKYLVQFIDAVRLDPLNWIIGPVSKLALVLLTLLVVRILAELAVAIFRINNNVSPDKGVSETADIDPVAEARRAAEMAAARTREVTASATEKTRSTLSDVKSSVGDTAQSISSKTTAATSGLAGAASQTVANAKDKAEEAIAKTPMASEKKEASAEAPVKRGRGRPKGSKNKPKAASAASGATTADAPVKRGRGRPKGSKNKPKPDAAAAAAPAVKRGPGRPKGSKNKPKPAPATRSTPGKRGPKKGQAVPRDADGNLLKKDGTPRKKPGPKPKS